MERGRPCGGLFLIPQFAMLSRMRGQVMRRDNFHSMTINELWELREKIGSVLGATLEREKRQLEARLSELGRHDFGPAPTDRQRRSYPKVHPKFQNPSDPSQTWAGRGKTPLWMNELLEAGKSIDELRIRESP